MIDLTEVNEFGQPVLEADLWPGINNFLRHSKIKVLVLYIAYPFSIASYFLTALRKRPDIDLKTCGPYTGNFIPWQNGMTLPMKYAVSPDVPLPQSLIGQTIDYNMVKAQLGDWKPDLVLNVDAGCYWSAKPSDGFVATIATDPHVLGYYFQRNYSDKFFNMQKFYIPAGSKDVYLPYAYSPEYHFPDDSIVKDTDAVMIGMPYPQRVDWINALRNRGVSVIFENGPIFEEARQLYARGGAGLNWSSLNDLNARAFELCAMKLYPVMNDVPDAHRFECFSRASIFKNMNEAVDMVVWAKEHPAEVQQQAQLAYETVQGQTYDARISMVLEECGFYA